MTAATVAPAALPSPTKIFHSLGGGTQSSCMALMAAAGEIPRPDAIIFADTRDEMPGTYRYLKYLERHLTEAGIPLVVVSGGDLWGDIRAKAGKGMQPTPPVRVLDDQGELQRVSGYTCSFDYKRRVITAEVKRRLGPRGAWKQADVTQVIGYTTDEQSRMKTDLECRCGHMKTHRVSRRTGRDTGHRPGGGCYQCGCARWDPWRVNDYPLITEFGMSRSDAQKWLTRHGHPVPPRSACSRCPNRGNSHWRDLRDNHPDLWEQACDDDEFIRHGLNGMRGAAFIHQSGVPLAEADLRPAWERRMDGGVIPLFTDAEISTETGMDCDAGVCFT